MEWFNFLLNFSEKKAPIYNNNSLNCSISIVDIYCKKTGGKCLNSCNDLTCIKIKIVKRNDN